MLSLKKQEKKTEFKSCKTKTEKGYIALVSVIIIVALLILVAAAAAFYGIGEVYMGFKKSQGEESFYLSAACAEEALTKLKESLNYGGNETLTSDSGNCTILPIEGSGNEDRIVKTIGRVGGAIRKIRIGVKKVNLDMEINSWQ